jgi:three-Cys-motif partner protein
MSVRDDPLEFFDEANDASRHKLAILQKYLRPLSYKLGSGWPRLYVIDGFAGAGEYKPDAAGQSQLGSPAIAARWARELEVNRGRQVLRCINVERNAGVYEQLRANLAPWKHLLDFYKGDFADHLDPILATVGAAPAFFFLDPFGVNGIEMAVLERILARPSQTTELLIHFSDKSFRRMAGHLDDNDKRTEVGNAVADAKVARLDAVVGSKLWQRIWLDKDRTTDERIEAIQQLYCSELKARGFKFAHSIPMRDSYRKRARYTLAFATNSLHGVDLMSDIACRYRRGQYDEAHQDSFDGLWEVGRREDDVGALRDDIHRAGLALGSATPQQLRHDLVDSRFGEFVTPDYAKALRLLVDEKRIDRPTSKGIKDDEQLVFIRPDQESMFG